MNVLVNGITAQHVEKIPLHDVSDCLEMDTDHDRNASGTRPVAEGEDARTKYPGASR